MPKLRTTAFISALPLLLLPSCTAVEKAAAPAPPKATPAGLAERCAALPGLLADPGSGLPSDLVVTRAELVEATSAAGRLPALPRHCNVTGTLHARKGAESSPGKPQAYAIKWQIRLPIDWNGDFSMQGGGGLNGSIADTRRRLADGFVTAASDSGHDNDVNNDEATGGAVAFGTDHLARVDFAYNAITRTSGLAKQVAQAFYGASPRRSYFEGCSMGGREAMMVAQRLPEQFDGVVAGDPGFKLTTMSTQEIFNAQEFGKLAKSMGLTSKDGTPLISNIYSNKDLTLVTDAVLRACDADDGVADGMVARPLMCTTDKVSRALATSTCKGAKTDACLAPAQVKTLVRVFEGPVTPKGVRPYYPLMWDAGLSACMPGGDCKTPNALTWRGWKLGTYQDDVAAARNNAFDFFAGGAVTTVLAPTPPNTPVSMTGDGFLKKMLSYDLDSYIASIHATNAAFPVSSFDLLEADSTDLSGLKSRGGKLIVWQPQSGGPFSPVAMVDWYEKLNRANGGTATNYAATQSFARLFMIPGMQHCAGGPATGEFDLFKAVRDWVERDRAPDGLIASAGPATPWPGRTRPLCAFPKAAVYNGSGSIEDAANFTCK